MVTIKGKEGRCRSKIGNAIKLVGSRSKSKGVSIAILTSHTLLVLVTLPVAHSQVSGTVGTYNFATDGLDATSVAGIVAPVPDVSPLILFASGLLRVSVYFVYGRCKKEEEGEQKRVLHVDDEAAFLGLTEEFLKREGREEFEITSVLSAEEALAKLAMERFDVIISDFRIPGTDGLEFLEEVRKMEEYVPFVLFSGMAEPEVVTEALKKGADRYIAKAGDPITFNELAQAIRELVEEKKG